MQAELQKHPQDEEAWSRFTALPEPERADIVEALKAQLDQLVRSNPTAALELAHVLFRAAESTPSRKAVGYRGRAVAQHINDHPKEALRDYLQAIELYRGAGAELEVARLERALIDLYHLTGRVPEAFESAARARATFERLGEERQLAQLEVNLGNVHFRQDNLVEAGPAYAAAAARFLALGDETGTAIAEYNRGNVEVFAGRYAEADSAYAAAAAIFVKKQQLVHVAECEYARAWMLSMRCRFAEAIPALEAAAVRFREVARPSRAPLCDLDLAELYLRLDARWDAAHAATRAIDAFAELGLDYERAKALTVRGLATRRTSTPAQALADLEQARQLLGELGNEHAQAALATQMHATAVAAGQVTSTLLSQLEEAHERLAASPHILLRGMSTILLARARTASGHADVALALLRPFTETAAAREGVDILIESDALRACAEAFEASGNPSDARQVYERAVASIEATRASVPGTDARLAFFRDRHGAYVSLARLCAESGDARQGLHYLELGRRQEARQRQLAATDAKREALDGLLLKRLDADLGALTGNAEADAKAPTDADLLAAELALTNQLRERGLAPSTTNTKPTTPLAATGEAVLSYLIDEGRISVFVITQNGCDWIALPASESEVQACAERLELALRKRLQPSQSPTREARALAKIEAGLQQLGTWLVAPALAKLDQIKSLVVIPYGSLHGLPFHAMQLGGDALIERFEVSQSASLAALERSRLMRQLAPAPRLMVAARDTSLPAIAAEADALVRVHAGQLDELDPGALFDALDAISLAGASLHIAAHGAFQPHNPLFSGLALGERVLTAHDVRSRKLDLEIVTLGGCETGRSGRIEGEALIGIDQAFLAAGAHAVVSSLWVVQDETAARQMEALHRELEAGEPIGRALARIQRADLAKSRHPYDWAPFVLNGDPAARFSPSLRSPEPPS